MILRVTRYGEAVLREAGERVDVFDAALRKLVEDMVETMYAAEGIGLAAQQIGVPRQICVVDLSLLPEEDLDYELDGKRVPIDLIMPMAIINPELTVLPGSTVAAEEGCLSFPAIRADIPRVEAIEVAFQDVKGEPHRLRCRGWFARVVQHEVDHLKGVLFIDHLDRRQLRLLEPRLTRLKGRVEREMRDPAN
jgi:peptide deformylase